ncbi:hypothetical protein CC2G_011151 [Coprinopsis cinerea AmutBmut pab1-1]|nr:hypothetical protein CC2G_011151 [Coprinopsis cinerea AmutBmut pab1-1]
MPGSTKRKHRSSFTDVELLIALSALRNLAKKLRQEMEDGKEELGEGTELDKEAEGTIIAQIKELKALLQANTDGPQMGEDEEEDDLLDKMGIRCNGTLKVKDDAPTRGAMTDALGEKSLWSANTLFAHLCMLETLVPQSNEGAVRHWTNAFFYRVSSMVPEGFKMVLCMEQVAPAVTLSDRSPHTESGFVDYAVVVMPQEQHFHFLRRPILRPDDSVLLVSEAKYWGTDLNKHIPHTIVEMHGYARRAEKKMVRGVVTNGFKWIFLILTLHDDGTATYVQSSEITYAKLTARPSKEGVSMISAILTHWVVHSHEPFNGDTDKFFLTTN